MKTPEYWHIVLMGASLISTKQDVILEIQNEAYNQAIFDLAADDLLPDKEKNFKKYLKNEKTTIHHNVAAKQHGDRES